MTNMRSTGVRVAAACCICLGLLVSCDRGRKPSVVEEAAAAAGRGIDRATKERTLGRFESMRVALTRYSIDHDGSMPTGSSMSDLRSALAPQYVPILESEDSWGNTMSYASDGRTYTIVSPGPDHQTGTADDITMQDGSISGGS